MKKAELIEIAASKGATEAEIAKLGTKTKAEIEALLAAMDEKQPKSMSGTLLRYRQRYVPSISASDRKSLNCGDEIASLLAGMEPKDVISAAERLLELETNTLWDKYANLNVGQQRMNAGNRIRGAVKRGDRTVEDVKKAIKAA